MSAPANPITVPYLVLAKGYTVSGDLKSGYKATVPYIVNWADAFKFADQVMGRTTAQTVGVVSFFVPYVFPGSTSARLYPSGFEIEPCGTKGAPLEPTMGLTPGEFFTNARVTVQFQTPEYSQQQGDDPQNLQQLDPQNPITLCKQSVKLGGKMVSRKGSGYRFPDNSMVAGDLAVPEKECKLVLNFPKVPYLPWQFLAPYVGCLNQYPILGCDKGTLLLEAPDTEVVGMSDGTIGQSLTLEFAWQADDWNKIRRPDTGRLAFVYQAGSVGDATRCLFTYADFTKIFQTLGSVAS